MAAGLGFPEEGGLLVISCYSIIVLPLTLRAIRDCSLYVRIPINTLGLASFECLHSALTVQN